MVAGPIDAVRRRRPLVPVLIAVAVLLGACSSDSDESNASCSDDLSTLKSDVSDLTSIDVPQEGTNAVDEQLNTINADVSALKDSASSAAASALEPVDTAVDDLQSTLSDAGSDPSASSLQAVVMAITAVGDAATTAFSSLDDACS